MAVRDAPPEPPPPAADQPNPYPAEKARGGRIILRARWQRIVFIGGLIAAVVIAVIVRWLS